MPSFVSVRSDTQDDALFLLSSILVATVLRQGADYFQRTGPVRCGDVFQLIFDPRQTEPRKKIEVASSRK